jgi:hypothetical protein
MNTTTKRFTNTQSGNQVTLISDKEKFSKYHEKISSELTIIIEGATDENGYEYYAPRISRSTELDTYLDRVDTCLDDSLSQVEQYLDSVGMAWSYSLPARRAYKKIEWLSREK